MTTEERLSAEERRERLLEAALTVFAEKGRAGARTRDIARAAGVSETLIYRHFQGKDALYEACLESMSQDHPILADVAQAMARGDDREVLAGIAAHMFDHMRRDPRLLRLHLFEALDRLHHGHGPDAPAIPAMEHKNPAETGLADYLARRARAGALVLDDPALAAKLFLYWVYMCLMDAELAVTHGPPRPDRALAEILAERFLHGARPPER